MSSTPLSYSFGTLGTVCWSVQLLPQIWLNYRRHNAVGLQPTMMMFWAWAGVPLGVYNIVSNFNIALQIQPQILAVLSLLTWIQCFYYEHKWSVWKAFSVVGPIAAVMGGIEVGLIYALRHGLERGIGWPVTLMAILAALFLALGVLRHYWDVWVHRTVRGISFVFVGIDALGDLFSIISVLFEHKLNILGLVIYGVELILWIGIFAAGGYYNLFPWVKAQVDKRRAAHPSREDNEMTVADDGAPPVVLHELPSSTSVFRTPSSDFELRSRANATNGDA